LALKELKSAIAHICGTISLSFYHLLSDLHQDDDYDEEEDDYEGMIPRFIDTGNSGMEFDGDDYTQEPDPDFF
jgi:hypothetical protein